MPVQQHERPRGAAYDRLAETMDAVSAEAAANGLTDADLEALLAVRTDRASVVVDTSFLVATPAAFLEGLGA